MYNTTCRFNLFNLRKVAHVRLLQVSVILLCFLLTICFVNRVSAGSGEDEAKQDASSKSQPVLYPALRDEILEMARVDQVARRGVRAKGKEKSEPVESMMVVDRRNTARMYEIIEKYGWPTKSKVGEQGAHMAWLLVQHADQDVAFQQKCLKLLKASFDKKEVSIRDIAYLTDRVLVNTGQPQQFGTQFHTVGGKLIPRPMVDPENVDKRRAAHKLSTLAEYKKVMAGG